MRATTRLHVHAFDLEHADAALASRGLHAHAAHQLRVGVELGLADPAVAHRVRFGDQARDAGAQGFLVQRLVHVEIQPRVAGGDRAAIDRVRYQRAQQMGGGVEALVGLAFGFINHRQDMGTGNDAPRLAASRGHMHNAAGHAFDHGSFARVGDGDFKAIFETQHTAVTGLATAERVEHGAVEHDAAFVDRDHGGLALQQRGVFAEEFFGHGVCRLMSPREPRSIAVMTRPGVRIVPSTGSTTASRGSDRACRMRPLSGMCVLGWGPGH